MANSADAERTGPFMRRSDKVVHVEDSVVKPTSKIETINYLAGLHWTFEFNNDRLTHYVFGRLVNLLHRIPHFICLKMRLKLVSFEVGYDVLNS